MAKAYTYIGPDYANHIVISTNHYKPKDWSQGKIRKMIKRDSRLSRLFVTKYIPKPVVSNDDDSDKK